MSVRIRGPETTLESGLRLVRAPVFGAAAYILFGIWIAFRQAAAPVLWAPFYHVGFCAFAILRFRRLLRRPTPDAPAWSRQLAIGLWIGLSILALWGIMRGEQLMNAIVRAVVEDK